ncbi:hypothetical protein ILYODFUR_036952 [Ilyodon furcidens]|uniref:Uncharacterized protein n=1 Tax=Ilyodon furcidens TaxID=33524 RepID=A0ABV0UBH8_9TELE
MSSNRRSFYLLLAGFNSTWSESQYFIYGKLNNAAGVDVSGFIRDGTSLESTITYSRSSVWITVAFSSISVYPGPSLRTCCPALGESASGTPTTGAVSPLQNACLSVFGE